MPIGKRREFEVFTLSFLDCICCGFGAIILLLVLTDVGQPIVIERSERDPNAQIHDLQRQLFEIRGVNSLLLLGDFITVNKKPEIKWSQITARVEKVLADV